MAPTAVFVRRAEADSASAASPSAGETGSAENQVCETGRKVGMYVGFSRREKACGRGSLFYWLWILPRRLVVEESTVTALAGNPGAWL